MEKNIYKINISPLEDLAEENKYLAKSLIKLEKLLAIANSKRKTKILEWKDILKILENIIIDHKEYDYVIGKGKIHLYGKATVCFSCMFDNEVFCGIGVSRYPKPSPGRAWKDLSPFQPNRWKKDTFRKKICKWINNFNVLRITFSEDN